LWQIYFILDEKTIQLSWSWHYDEHVIINVTVSNEELSYKIVKEAFQDVRCQFEENLIKYNMFDLLVEKELLICWVLDQEATHPTMCNLAICFLLVKVFKSLIQITIFFS